MKTMLFFLAPFLSAAFTSFGQESQIVLLFQDQVAAFNSHDSNRLANNVSEDFEYLYVSGSEIIAEAKGRENFRKGMMGYFSSLKTVSTEVTDYFVVQNKISFKEVVSYENKDGEVVRASALGIYQIENGKISKAWYFVN